MLGHYFWHVQIRIHRQNVCFVFFRIYCLDVIKMSKLLTREMSRAPVINCFCRTRLFSSKMITCGYTVWVLIAVSHASDWWQCINAFSKARMLDFCGLTCWKKPDYPEETPTLDGRPLPSCLPTPAIEPG